MKSILKRIRARGARSRRFGLALVLLTLAGGWLALPAGAQGPPVRIAVVNLEYVVATSPAGQALQGKLEKFQSDVRAQVEAKASAIRETRQRISDGANTLSEDRLAELQKDLEDQQIAARRLQDDKQREGQKMQEEGLREIEKQLQPVFEEIRDEGGYDLILNNVPGVVVMAGPRVDITQTVVDKLKAASGG